MDRFESMRLFARVVERRSFTQAANDILAAQGAAMLQYGPSLGFLPLREWLAEWQHVDTERVLTALPQLLAVGDKVFKEGVRRFLAESP